MTVTITKRLLSDIDQALSEASSIIEWAGGDEVLDESMERTTRLIEDVLRDIRRIK